MRVTNKMMSAGMLNNIMSNKADMNKKFNQYATGQKIQKPSEDPVVAIRSLKYRANLTQVDQYLKKNVKDAYNWMDVTESAINSMKSLMTDITTYVTQGANDTYETIDRDSISKQLQQYKEELYGMLNTDNAGRYVFSGYRTDTTVTYLEEENLKQYTITEPLTFENMHEKKYVKGCAPEYIEDPGKDSATNAADNEAAFAAATPKDATVYCLNLGYKNLDSEMEVLRDANNDPVVIDGQKQYTGLKFEYTDAAGVSHSLDLKACKSTDKDVYEFADGEDVKFLADTGQIIFSQNGYNALRTATSITTTYKKSEFEVGDVRPEMYYDCTAVGIEREDDGKIVMVKEDPNETDPDKVVFIAKTVGEPITYKKPENQDIKYNVSTSQSLKVNTLANQTLNSSYARALDNVMEAVNAAYDTQSRIEDVELVLSDSNITPEKKEAYTKLKEKLNVELNIRKSIIQETFGRAITATQNAQSGAKVAYKDGTVKKIGINISSTDLGSRYKRLDMIKTRLEDQTTSITELADSNEQVDLEEAIVNYQDAYITYTASLSATGKVAQNTLLDFL